MLYAHRAYNLSEHKALNIEHVAKLLKSVSANNAINKHGPKYEPYRTTDVFDFQRCHFYYLILPSNIHYLEGNRVIIV